MNDIGHKLCHGVATFKIISSLKKITTAPQPCKARHPGGLRCSQAAIPATVASGNGALTG